MPVNLQSRLNVGGLIQKKLQLVFTKLFVSRHENRLAYTINMVNVRDCKHYPRVNTGVLVRRSLFTYSCFDNHCITKTTHLLISFFLLNLCHALAYTFSFWGGRTFDLSVQISFSFSLALYPTFDRHLTVAAFLLKHQIQASRHIAFAVVSV